MNAEYLRQLAFVALAAFLIRPAAAQLSYSRGQTTSPAYEGWEKNADGSFNLLFGYMNSNWEEEFDVPIGPENNIQPGGPDRGQPTHFFPRRNRFVFRVRVPQDFGEKELVWTLVTHGKTLKAYGTLRQDYFLDNMVFTSETGAIGAGVSSPEIRANKAPVLEAAAKLLRRSLGENISLQLQILPGIWPVRIDVSQLDSSLLNLAVNARDAMPNGGRLIIEASNVCIDKHAFERNQEATPGDYVLLAVSDTGSGMSPEVLARVFEPFYTTKGNRGSGLGLSMVHGFIKQSGGYSKIYSEPGKGTTIRIYLPRALDGDVSEPDTLHAGMPTGDQEVILVVEDNAAIRDLAVRHLESLGYRTISAADGGSALAIIKSGVLIDLLFTDVVMPGGLDGRALAAEARRFVPGLQVLFTSGFTAAAASAAIEDKFGSNLLSKPYRKSDLARRVRTMLDASESRDSTCMT